MTVTMKANRSYKLVVHKKGFGGSGEFVLKSSVSLEITNVQTNRKHRFNSKQLMFRNGNCKRNL